MRRFYWTDHGEIIRFNPPREWNVRSARLARAIVRVLNWIYS